MIVLFFFFQCALKCVEMRLFVCRSFHIEKQSNECLLFDVNIGMVGGLVESDLYTYYELITQSGVRNGGNELITNLQPFKY